MGLNHVQHNSAAASGRTAWFVAAQLETAVFAKSTANKEHQYCFAAPYAQFNTSIRHELPPTAVKRNCVPVKRAPFLHWRGQTLVMNTPPRNRAKAKF